MHNQSDYGYSLPTIEDRSFAICLERARRARDFAREYRGTPHEAMWWRHAHAWVNEARTRRDSENRRLLTRRYTAEEIQSGKDAYDHNASCWEAEGDRALPEFDTLPDDRKVEWIEIARRNQRS